MDQLTSFVTLLLALSIASERLVEIVKGWFPKLDQENPDPVWESRRQSLIHLLAVLAGVVTSFMAAPVIGTPLGIPKLADHPEIALALGLLASGGSGLWNSVLSYLKGVKDIKDSVAQTMSAQAVQTRALASAAARPQPPLGGGGRP